MGIQRSYTGWFLQVKFLSVHSVYPSLWLMTLLRVRITHKESISSNQQDRKVNVTTIIYQIHEQDSKNDTQSTNEIILICKHFLHMQDESKSTQ